MVYTTCLFCFNIFQNLDKVAGYFILCGMDSFFLNNFFLGFIISEYRNNWFKMFHLKDKDKYDLDKIW